MMNKTKILGIAPFEGISQLMKQVAERRNDIELTVFVGDLNEGLNIASNYTLHEFDVIVSRGGTAELLQDSCSIPVVEISLSSMDILRSIKLAQNYSSKYAFIGFPSITKNASFLCELLQYNIDIYTIHDETEARDTLEQLTAKGIYMVLCDMITFSLAQQLGLTAILITSGSESIETAYNKAVEISKAFHSMNTKIAFYEELLSNSAEIIYAYDTHSNLIYCSKKDSLPELIQQELLEKITDLTKEKNTRFYKEEGEHRYEVTGIHNIVKDCSYFVFYINQKKQSVTYKKGEIRYFSKDEANRIFYQSFFGNTQSVLYSDSLVRQYSESKLPIIITGEEGTGQDQLAFLLYSKSNLSTNPLIMIDFKYFTAESWTTFMKDAQAPFNDSYSTILLKNMDLLSDPQFDDLHNALQDLTLCSKNRFLFSFNQNDTDAINSRIYQVTNSCSCLTFEIPSLRSRIELLADLSSIYISTLNMHMAKEILGFEESALTAMQAYDWPGNYTQLATVLNELVTATDTPYIKTSTVNRLLQKKSVSNGCHFSQVNLNLSNKTLEEINLELLKQVIAEENGNQSAAAKRLGISRTTLWRMLQK